MELFGVGPGELILILIIALIVFGPKRLPEIGAALGKAVREFQQMSQELTTELNREMDATRDAIEGPKDAKEAKDETGDHVDGGA